MFSTFDHGQAMVQISQGSPGAISVCSKIFGGYPLQVSQKIFQAMIDRKITGPAVWVLYKDEAQEDLAKTVSLILTRHLDGEITRESTL
jgi:hypothetical protein